MAFDPVSVAFSAAPFVREAIERFRSQNEARRFFYVLQQMTRRNADVPEAIRRELAHQLFMLHVDPNFRSPLDDYLDRFDASATAEIEPYIRQRVSALVDGGSTADTVIAVMRDVERALNQAKQSDRDSNFLQAERTINAVQQLGARTAPVALLDLDWAPDWPQRALRKLGEESPGELVELQHRVGTGEDLETVRHLIREPDPWTARASRHIWVALARFAEHHGDWDLAREGWQRAIALAADNDERVKYRLQMALNASIAGDEAMYEADMAQAREVDANHPRLRFEELSHGIMALEPEEQLARLAAFEFEHPVMRALVNARRALASLLLPDVARAREFADAARATGADLLQVEMVDANVVIQENRMALVDRRPIDAIAVRAAQAKALEVRQRLVSQRRPEESARLLMLAADAANIAGSPNEAADVLGHASDEERLFGEGDVVLAEAALRALRPDVALSLLHPDKPETDTHRRIRAHARLLTRGEDHRAAAAELDVLVAEGGEEIEMAAHQRLLAAVTRDVDWSDEAEAALVGHRQVVTSLKALWFAKQGDLQQTQALIGEDRSESWGGELLFRALAGAGDYRGAADMAIAYSERHVPTQDLRFEFALVFADVGDLSRARAELRQVVEDSRAPSDTRAKAYRALAELTPDYSVRLKILEGWGKDFPDDPGIAEEFARMDRQLRTGA
jgi:hypothetical protein